jgi:hypothetical protein
MLTMAEYRDMPLMQFLRTYVARVITAGAGYACAVRKSRTQPSL